MDIASLLIVLFAFAFAGTVKGFIGVGLPSISIAILSSFMPLTTAIQIMVVPGFCANLWQALDGRHFIALIKRLWIFLVANMLAAWLAYRYVLFEYPREMTILLAVLLCLYAIGGLGFKLPGLKAGNEKFLGPLFGGATGFFAGTTGNTTMPSIAYLESLRLDRNEMVQAMGLTFGAPLFVIALVAFEPQSSWNSVSWIAVLALLPTFAGMWLGRMFRHRISEQLFRKLLFIALLFIGIRLLVVNCNW